MYKSKKSMDNYLVEGADISAKSLINILNENILLINCIFVTKKGYV
jgi:hypothetical protein